MQFHDSMSEIGLENALTTGQLRGKTLAHLGINCNFITYLFYKYILTSIYSIQLSVKCMNTRLKHSDSIIWANI